MYTETYLHNMFVDFRQRAPCTAPPISVSLSRSSGSKRRKAIIGHLKYIFCLGGWKYHFRSRRPIANVVFSASLGKKKIVYVPWDQIKNASNRMFVTPTFGSITIYMRSGTFFTFTPYRCVIYYFIWFSISDPIIQDFRTSYCTPLFVINK